MLLLVGAVLAGSIAVAFGAARVGVPSLVAFLALGMLLGSDGPGGIEFDDAELARKVGIVGLAAILYEGGLSTSWRRLRSRRRARRAAEHRRRRRHRAAHRRSGLSPLRSVLARVRAARRGRRVDRRRGRVRDAALHAHPATARAHARSGDGAQRSGRDRADDRTDRLDREAELRVPGSLAPRRPSARRSAC